MEKFTINRELCELDFTNKDLKAIDVDVMEFVWVKIREIYEHPTPTIGIYFTEMRNAIGRYGKASLIESVKYLDGLTIETNQKSKNQSQCFTLSFAVDADMKGFSVGVGNELFELFNKPKSYCEYSQNYVYQFNEKHSKLLYKFLIGYKFLKGKSIYIHSDELMKIMNVNADKPLSKIQSDIFKSSVEKIKAKTDLDVSFEKFDVVKKKNQETVKYIITINNWESKMEGKDLKRNKTAPKTYDQKRIDRWINNLKKEAEFDPNTTKVPMIVLKNDVTHLPLYVDSEYRLADAFNKYTETPKQTLDTMNGWVENSEIDWDVELMDGYAKEFGKMCLLSPQQLKQRNLI